MCAETYGTSRGLRFEFVVRVAALEPLVQLGTTCHHWPKTFEPIRGQGNKDTMNKGGVAFLGP